MTFKCSGEDSAAFYIAFGFQGATFADFQRLSIKRRVRSRITAIECVSYRSLALSIAYAKHLLNGKRACRVQGGGFAGTAEAFVPNSEVEEFTRKFTELFGENSVLTAGIRNYGAVEVKI